MSLPSLFDYMPEQAHALCKAAAFDLETAKQVLQAAKPKVVKIGKGYSFAPSSSLKDDRKLLSSLVAHGAAPTIAKREVGAPVSRLGVEKIIAPRRGDATTALRAHPLPGTRQAAGAVHRPEDRQLLDGVVKGHELAESQVDPALSFRKFRHRSPDVILREHNMVATLPQDAGAVRGVLQARRAEGGEAAVLARHGVIYGEGARLSRHARRHITNAIEQDYAPHVRALASTMKEAEAVERTPGQKARGAAKSFGTGLLGFTVGSLAGAGGAYLMDKGYEAATGKKIPLSALHMAAPVVGGAAGIAYNLYQAKQQEELRRALESKSDRPQGRIPPK